MKRTAFVVFLVILLGTPLIVSAVSPPIEPAKNYDSVLAESPDADIIFAGNLVIVKSHKNEWVVCGIKIKKLPLYWRDFREMTGAGGSIPVKVTSSDNGCVRFLFADPFHRDMFQVAREGQ